MSTALLSIYLYHSVLQPDFIPFDKHPKRSYSLLFDFKTDLAILEGEFEMLLENKKIK